MARPRSFNSDHVVEAAKGVFWNKGYQGTAIEDLERETGLSRSSLYGAFGAKKQLFGRALDVYMNTFVDPRLAPMERPDAGLSDVAGFFAGLAELFRTDDPTARRGCLMVNSIAEFEGRGTELAGRAGTFRDRLGHAFANALAGEADPATIDERAQLLTVATLGVWLATRIDPAGAARTCDALRSQALSWSSSSQQ